MHSPVSIITGGPGTGKTFTTRAIVDVWNKLGLRVKLACPTARAAHRLNGVTSSGSATQAGCSSLKLTAACLLVAICEPSCWGRKLALP